MTSPADELQQLMSDGKVHRANQKRLLDLFQQRSEENSELTAQEFWDHHRYWVGIKQKHLPSGTTLAYLKGCVYFRARDHSRFARLNDVTNLIYQIMAAVEEKAVAATDAPLCESFHAEHLKPLKESQEQVAYCRSWEGQIQVILYQLLLLQESNQLRTLLPKPGQIPEDFLEKFGLEQMLQEHHLYPCPDRSHQEGNFEMVKPLLMASIRRIIFNNVNRCEAYKLTQEVKNILIRANIPPVQCQKIGCSEAIRLAKDLLSGVEHPRAQHQHNLSFWRQNEKELSKQFYQLIWSQKKTPN